MRADRDDAPVRVQSGKKHRPLLFALVLVIGTIGLGSLASAMLPNIVKSRETLSNTIQSASQSTRSSPSMDDNPYQPIVETAEDHYLDQVNRMLGITDDYISEPAAHIEWSEPQQENRTDRQTVFSDATYTPAATVNTIRMPRPQSQSAPQAQTRQQPYVTVVKETRQRCWPFREGSAECRKHKSQLYQIHSRNCLKNGNSQSVSCRQAKRYDLR